MAPKGIGGCTRSWSRGGEQVGLELVRQLIRELGLVACQPRPWRTTTVQDGEQTTTPDLVGRDFTADTPGCKLVGDITYIRTWAGWLYLATVIDCFNKEVIGYAMADHMRTSLVATHWAWLPETIGWRWAAFSIPTVARNAHQPNSLRNSLHCRCGNPWAAPGVVTIMRWPNPFSHPSKMSGCTVPSIRPGTKRNKILPAILKYSIIGNGSTQL